MPWKETCQMEERFRLIEAFRREPEPTLAEVCREIGVSRKTAYKWIARYEAEGSAGLRERTSAAKAQPRHLTLELEDAVVTLRKQHSTWGPKKLLAVLRERRPETSWPAASTMGEVLKRRGLIRPRKRRLSVLRGGAGALHCDAPNDLWCMDFKGSFLLGDLSRCHPFTLTDGASRFLLRCERLEAEQTDLVKDALTSVFSEFGLPLRLRSDNGPPFGSATPGGLSRLAVWLIRIGVTPEFITPGHPEQNGRHERMHRTMKAETTNPVGKTPAEQQRIFDVFRKEYNEVRPHEALKQVPPKQRYEPSKRPYRPELISPTYQDQDTRYVSKGGEVTFAGKRFYAGQLLANEPVGLRQVGEALFEVSYGPIRLGFLLTTDAKPKLRLEAPLNSLTPVSAKLTA